MKKETKILLALFIIIVIIRISLAFFVPNFTYESYFHLRQVEQITQTGLPVYEDLLSYGGRERLFLPFFHYFMAFFNLFLPLTIVAKIIPNLLIASIALIVYLIAKKITNYETASLLSALIAGFLPILFFTNSFTVEALFLPVIFISIYAFINLKEAPLTPLKNIKESVTRRKFIFIYIGSFLILTLTSSLTFLLLVGFGIYMLLSLLEGKKINKAELEMIIFSTFFFLWIQLLFFKNSLLQEGLAFIWQNVPTRTISSYFPHISILQALLWVSIIPFLAGIFVAYKSLFELKNQRSFLLISFVISTTLLAWFRLIRFKQSLAFFGIVLAILFASFYLETDNYFKKTKLFRWRKYLLPVTVILLLISMVIPAVNVSFQQDTPTKEEVAAFQWINENALSKSAVFARLEEGHLITYYSNRKNMMDDQFGQIKDVNKRFNDLNSLFTTRFQTQAISLAEEYDLQYLILTPSAKEQYNLSKKFNYAIRRCFEPVYTNETQIFLVKCKVKELE